MEGGGREEREERGGRGGREQHLAGTFFSNQGSKQPPFSIRAEVLPQNNLENSQICEGYM